MTTAVKATGVMVVAAILVGCGMGAGKPTGQVTLTVTDRFGTVPVGKVVSADAPGAETAMRQLIRAHRVESRYEGRFVQSIDGLEGGTAAGRPVDWVIFVNGLESTKGAADVALHAGDSVWWDRRDWGAATHVPAVVGSWPQPFRSGRDGKRLAVRLICPPGGDTRCAEVERVLVSIGASPAKGIPGVSGKGSGLRVVVGEWSAIRNDPAAAGLARGPGASGVYVKPSGDGGSFELLDPAARKVAQLGEGTGMVAATGEIGSPPTWLVTGIGPQGLERAVAALDSRTLARRYAVLIASDGSVRGAPEVPR
jgi:hypothetical protein